MQDNFDDIWDAMLKAAVIENTYNEIKDYPSTEAINEIELPLQYDVKMRKFIRHYQKSIKLRKFRKYAYRTASLLLIAAGIAFIILLQFDEVRASCKNVVIHICERFIQYDFKPSDNVKDIIEVSFVPEGYRLENKESKSNGMNIIYKGNSGDTIRISFFKDNRTIYLDNEHYSISDIQINNTKGEFFDAQSEGFKNYITWSTENGCFYIASYLDCATMIKIAESIE